MAVWALEEDKECSKYNDGFTFGEAVNLHFTKNVVYYIRGR